MNSSKYNFSQKIVLKAILIFFVFLRKQYSDIEEQFKGKYKVLKVCYEQRIRY